MSSRGRLGPTWTSGATWALLALGVILAIVSFASVLAMPDLLWHPARDAELRATYDAYRETGTLLIKATGSGSYGVQAPAPGPLTFATWDDDPGSYIIASLMSHVTGSDSPYPGLELAQALLVALPLVWLPLAVARVVGRVRAGLAVVLLPVVMFVLNHGTWLAGTEYGQANLVSGLPVYSLYGTAASLVFLSLSVIVLLSTFRLSLPWLIVATVGIGILGAVGNLARSLSGIGVALGVGVLWWLWARRRSWRWLAAPVGALLAVVIAMGLQGAIMQAINVTRAETTGQSMEEVPDAHTAWHSLYLGLSYPTPITGEPSRFDVTWSDEFGWEKAREVDPDVLIASDEYDHIMRGLFLDAVSSDPIGAVKLYMKKAVYVGLHFAGLILLIAAGFVVGMFRRGRVRGRLGSVLAICTPVLLLGLVPAVLVMPMLYYFSELTASLSMLTAVALGVLGWALLSWPSRARAKAPSRRRAEASTATAALDADAVPVGSVDDGDVDTVDLAATGDPGGPVRASTARTVLIRSGDAGASSRLLSWWRALLLDTPALGDADAVRVDGAWARSFAEGAHERGGLWLQELLYAARLQGVDVEVERGAEAGPAELRRAGVRTAAGYVRIANRADEYAVTTA